LVFLIIWHFGKFGLVKNDRQKECNKKKYNFFFFIVLVDGAYHNRVASGEVTWYGEGLLSWKEKRLIPWRACKGIQKNDPLPSAVVTRGKASAKGG